MRGASKTAVALLVVGVCSVGLIRAGSDGERLPDTVYAWGESLQFVSLERAVDSAGRIDTDLLRESDAFMLRTSLEAPVRPDGCIKDSYDSPIDYPSPELRDTETALRSSDHVLIGRVVGLRAGYYSRLGHLVSIETEQVLAGSPNSRFYVFFPSGNFKFQGKKFCLKHEAYPDLPAVGDRMLVMHKNQIQGLLLGVVPTQLIVLPEDGPPDLGKNLTISAPGRPKAVELSFETVPELVEWTQHILAEADR